MVGFQKCRDRLFYEIALPETAPDALIVELTEIMINQAGTGIGDRYATNLGYIRRAALGARDLTPRVQIGVVIFDFGLCRRRYSLGECDSQTGAFFAVVRHRIWTYCDRLRVDN